MKKMMFLAALMTIAISASAAVKNSWPTTDVSKYPSWPVSKYPTEPKFPKYPSWPTEPVCSWPAC